MHKRRYTDVLGLIVLPVVGLLARSFVMVRLVVLRFVEVRVEGQADGRARPQRLVEEGVVVCYTLHSRHGALIRSKVRRLVDARR